MTDYKAARMRDGTLYQGNQRYAGSGIMRSCAKCGTHSASAGFKLVRPWGMLGKCCQKPPR